MNFDLMKEKFNISFQDNENYFEKIIIQPADLIDVLNSLKNLPEYDFDRLTQIICVDNIENIELIYDLYSTNTAVMKRICVILDAKLPKIASIVDVYKSAHFDECEIYDLFGVEFINNPKLKRLYMPKGWIGHPLRKDYVQSDQRLAWNEVKDE